MRFRIITRYLVTWYDIIHTRYGEESPKSSLETFEPKMGSDGNLGGDVTVNGQSRDMTASDG